MEKKPLFKKLRSEAKHNQVTFSTYKNNKPSVRAIQPSEEGTGGAALRIMQFGDNRTPSAAGRAQPSSPTDAVPFCHLRVSHRVSGSPQPNARLRAGRPAPPEARRRREGHQHRRPLLPARLRRLSDCRQAQSAPAQPGAAARPVGEARPRGGERVERPARGGPAGSRPPCARRGAGGAGRRPPGAGRGGGTGAPRGPAGVWMRVRGDRAGGGRGSGPAGGGLAAHPRPGEAQGPPGAEERGFLQPGCSGPSPACPAASGGKGTAGQAVRSAGGSYCAPGGEACGAAFLSAGFGGTLRLQVVGNFGRELRPERASAFRCEAWGSGIL